MFLSKIPPSLATLRLEVEFLANSSLAGITFLVLYLEFLVERRVVRDDLGTLRKFRVFGFSSSSLF